LARTQQMTLDLETHSESQHSARTSLSPWRRLGQAISAAIVAQQARRMLDRIVKPYRARGSPEVPPHLLEDIGLPRDYYASKPYWDHQ
jgi:hypothetical protein